MTVYTAIFGPVDELKEPFVVTEGWKYICFTDQDFKSDVWEIRKVPVMPCGPQKTARFYKIMFPIDDSESIWVDGTFFINVDLNKWWERFQYPFTTIKHPFDKCAYIESRSCIKLGKDALAVKNQIDCYRKLRLPKDNGLIASGILMRKRTPLVMEFCKLWWQQVYMFSARDQIAFAFADFKMPNIHNSIEWDYTKRDEFIHVPHLTKKWRPGRLQEIIQKYGSDKK